MSSSQPLTGEMTITNLDVFMGNLERLIYDKGNRLITSNRLIEAKMPEIKLLYEELRYLIESVCYNKNTDEELYEFEDVENWKRRLTNGAHEAENAVDMFISTAILKVRDSEIFTGEGDSSYISDSPPSFFGGSDFYNMNTDKKELYEFEKEMYEFEDVENWKRRLITFPILKVSDDEIFTGEGHYSHILYCPLNLNAIMEDLRSIRKEMQHKIRKSVNNNNIPHLVEPQTANPQVVAAKVNPSGAEHEQIIVGFDEVSLSIMDRLTGEYRKQLDIISIVGMGGVGKTTLASKIFNDQYVAYYFDIRAWITVSEAYTTRDLLIGILASMGISVHEAITEQKLCEMVYKSLKGRKYLMVIDDIWSSKAWDNLRQCFPDDYKGSRIILTTRLTEVAAHAKPGGFTHNLQCLTEEKSWELLCRKSFRGSECPQTLIETGKHIAQKCQGLPLALVVIAGILEKGEKSKDLWEKVAESVSSYIADDPKGCLDTLALSYEHLPHHLRNCFLYVGGFPEDYESKHGG